MNQKEETELSKEIGKRLRLIRQLKKIDINELINSFGLQTYNSLNHYELGKRQMGYKILYILQKMYNINLNHLISGTGEIDLVSDDVADTSFIDAWEKALDIIYSNKELPDRQKLSNAFKESVKSLKKLYTNYNTTNAMQAVKDRETALSPLKNL